MDIGATKNVYGLDQVKAHFEQTNTAPLLKPSSSRFRFKDFMYSSKKIILIQTFIDINAFIDFKVSAVTAA